MLKLKIDDIINTIQVGDCLKILRQVPDESVDLIFADPPYFMQTEGELERTDGSKFSGVDDDWDKFNDYKHYDKFCNSWLKECKRILKPNGSIWVIGAFQNIYHIGYLMQELGFWVINDIVWQKTNPAPNFKGTRFCNAHETMLWCNKGKNNKYTFNYKTMKHLNGGKQDRSVWEIGLAIGNERLKDKDGIKVHSTQKPEKLLYKVIASSSRIGDIVLDPFFGTGTTGAIAKRLGRNYIGIEQSQFYTDFATKRIEREKFEDSDIANGTLEIKPPRFSIQELVNMELLNQNEQLFDRTGKKVATICKDSKVDDGQEVLSIHKMSAKLLNLNNNNGWDYFFVKRNGKLKAINDFRYEAQIIKDNN